MDSYRRILVLFSLHHLIYRWIHRFRCWYCRLLYYWTILLYCERQQLCLSPHVLRVQPELFHKTKYDIMSAGTLSLVQFPKTLSQRLTVSTVSWFTWMCMGRISRMTFRDLFGLVFITPVIPSKEGLFICYKGLRRPFFIVAFKI